MDPPKEKGALEADGCCLIIILSVWASLGLGMQPSVIRSSCTFVSLCSAQPQHHLCQNSCAFDIILWVYELLFVIEIYPSNVMWQVVTEHSNSSHCHSTENVWKKNYAASTWVSGPEFTGSGWRSPYNQKITSFVAPGPLQCKRLEHGESSYLRLFACSVSKNPIRIMNVKWHFSIC